MNKATQITGLCGWGALLLLAALLPGPLAQATPVVSPASLQCAPAAGLTLNRDCPGVRQVCDLDDDDDDDMGELDLGTHPGTLPKSIGMTMLGDGSPSQGIWSLGCIKTTLSRPERGCTLRRRIFKKSR